MLQTKAHRQSHNALIVLNQPFSFALFHRVCHLARLPMAPSTASMTSAATTTATPVTL